MWKLASKRQHEVQETFGRQKLRSPGKKYKSIALECIHFSVPLRINHLLPIGNYFPSPRHIWQKDPVRRSRTEYMSKTPHCLKSPRAQLHHNTSREAAYCYTGYPPNKEYVLHVHTMQALSARANNVMVYYAVGIFDLGKSIHAVMQALTRCPGYPFRD